MPTRLAITTEGMESTPGDLTTHTTYIVLDMERDGPFDNAFYWSVSVIIHAYKANDEFPLYVSNSFANHGLFVSSSGTIYFREPSQGREISITHPKIAATLNVEKTYSVYRDVVGGNWKLAVDNFYIGEFANTGDVLFRRMSAIGGSSVNACAPVTLREYYIRVPINRYLFLFDGTGQSATWNTTTYTTVNFFSASQTLGVAGPTPRVPFIRIDDKQLEGRYYLKSVSGQFKPLLKDRSPEMAMVTPIPLNMNTQDWLLEMEHGEDTSGNIIVLDQTSTLIVIGIGIVNSGSIDIYSYNTSAGVALSNTGYYGEIANANTVMVSTTLHWNHVTRTFTWSSGGKVRQQVVTPDQLHAGASTFPMYEINRFFTYDEDEIYMGSRKLYRFKISIDGVVAIDADFQNMRLPQESEYTYSAQNEDILTVTPASGNPYILRRGKQFWTYDYFDNLIDYVGPTTVDPIAACVGVDGYLPFSKIEEWFRIDVGDDSLIVHSLITTAPYYRDDVNSRYVFTHPGNNTSNSFKVRVTVNGDINNYSSVTPSIALIYKPDTVNFEPTFFDSSAFDTTVVPPTHVYHDSFESTAFYWKAFNMTYSEAPQSVTRKLKYYAGSQWTGVPIKMWNAGTWVEVKLKAQNGSTWNTYSG